MTCPPEIADVVLEILSHGVLRIRAFASAGWVEKCFVESDHLHNLPAIVGDYMPERLRYYWDVERPCFMRQVPESERRDLQPMWDKLGKLVVSHQIPPLPDLVQKRPSAVVS